MLKLTYIFVLISIICSCKHIKDTKSPSSLYILGIGNSFTEDGMEYLPELIRLAGSEQITVARLFNGGLSLQQHDLFAKTDSAHYVYQTSDSTGSGWSELRRFVALREVLQEYPWDVIVIQQVSHLSGLYESYQPYLNDWIDSLKAISYPNKPLIVWQQTWPYSQSSRHNGFVNYNYDQQQMHHAIADAVSRMQQDTEMEYIIPTGDVIQSLRSTTLNNPPYELLRDDFHLDYGLGRYAAACTWYEILITPFCHIPLDSLSFNTDAGKIGVSSENRGLILQTVKEITDKSRKPLYKAK